MRSRAYTLIELLVTMSLLALLSGFVIPTYQLIVSQLELSGATNEVADFVLLTEQKTVTEQQIYGLTLTENATTLPQFLYDPVSTNKTAITTLTLPAHIKISAVNFSNTDVRFSTSGAPNSAGNFVLTDTVRNRSRRVEIRPSGAILTNTGEF